MYYIIYGNDLRDWQLTDNMTEEEAENYAETLRECYPYVQIREVEE